MAPTVLLECAEKKVLKRSFAMMAKSQKFAKGFSSSFVPDYRHDAEITGESEGFGSSGRVDSEDYSALKRKCISLNKDRGDCLNAPLEVISFAKMPSLERKELELRLRAELEQIQSLQKKFLSKSVATVSSFSIGHRKKIGSTGSHLKRGISGRYNSTKQRPQPQSCGGNSHASIMKQCESILNKLRTHQFGWVFKSPVDVVALKIPDYYTVIKHPMDLGTIKDKLSSGAYSSPLGFVVDVRLTFINAMTYNPPGSNVHIMADKLSKFFESKWKPIEKKLSTTDLYMFGETEAANPVSQPKERKASHVASNIVPEKVILRVSVEERQHLSSRLSSIAEDMPDTIVDLLRRNIKSTDEEEIEVDIDALSDDVLLELKKLLDDHLLEKQNGQHAKAEPTEMEIQNESGLSNSSMHPCKGNEPVDEDVDVGGTNPPISSYPLVEIDKDTDKDTTKRGSKCSSSSSSSSDSGSSSSDSDSGSSSGSQSDDNTASAKTAKVDVRPETVHDHDKSDTMNPLDTSRAINGLDQPEQDVCPNPLSSEGDKLQDGENAPSERQVSPEKLYRAALLRNRFADTILKAREKTLDQGEKGDQEKPRQEREELERQQREERARLQAEAKAAEAARKRAEAEAAAEAKRKRELEREAARQALLKIEKTVEINENSLILKDLELLGTVPGEHLPSSVDETSPDHSQDGVEDFKLGGSNPLEQLGLYMKEDDEEDEETELSTSVPLSTNDVEDGD